VSATGNPFCANYFDPIILAAIRLSNPLTDPDRKERRLPSDGA
jgi:hypothetical protein